MAWLKRVRGGASEVFEGVETSLGVPFEVPDALAAQILKAKDPRFEAATSTQAKAAAKKALEEAED